MTDLPATSPSSPPSTPPIDLAQALVQALITQMHDDWFFQIPFVAPEERSELIREWTELTAIPECLYIHLSEASLLTPEELEPVLQEILLTARHKLFNRAMRKLVGYPPATSPAQFEFAPIWGPCPSPPKDTPQARASRRYQFKNRIQRLWAVAERMGPPTLYVKLCESCLELKLIREFTPDVDQPDVLHPMCRRCVHAQQKREEEAAARAAAVAAAAAKATTKVEDPSDPDVIYRSMQVDEDHPNNRKLRQLQEEHEQAQAQAQARLRKKEGN